MKGQTIIELKDIKTGKVERHIDNNMMTNGVAEFMKSSIFTNYPNVPSDDLVAQLIGGIMLFDETLTENANTVYPPTSATMIGCGANGSTNSGAVTEMGSFNGNESGWQADGSYVQVFDFTTSQANGTIASVCLTSKVAARMGWGNAQSMAYYSRDDSIYSGSTNNFYLPSTSYIPISVDYTDSAIYATKDLTKSNIVNNGTIKVEKFLLPMSKYNLKGKLNDLVKLSETTLTVPQAYRDYINANDRTLIIRYDSEGNIFVLPDISGTGGGWSTSGTINILKFNASTMLGVITLQNTTGVNFSNGITYKYDFEHNYLVLWYGSDRKVYRISLADSSSIEFDGWSKNWTNEDTTDIKHRGGYLFKKNKMMLNVDEGIILPYNMSSNCLDMLRPVINAPQLNIRAGSNGAYTVIRDITYLASVNNLENAVVKTSDKTMKVSYRIAF